MLYFVLDLFPMFGIWVHIFGRLEIKLFLQRVSIAILDCQKITRFGQGGMEP